MIIYKCIDEGTDGTDQTTVGYCADMKLAERISLGRGTMGLYSGEIETIHVWESVDDLPDEILERMQAEEAKIENEVRVKEKFQQIKIDIRALLDGLSEDEREALVKKIREELFL